MNTPSRQNFEMSPADLEQILNASIPVPLIAIHLGMPQSPQERANAAWQELGDRLGFDFMTVEPTGQGDRFFSAVPKEIVQTEPKEKEEGN